ncbi:MAG: hypothetical protein ACKO39_10315, partial [Chthoniobacterales bacterium]
MSELNTARTPDAAGAWRTKMKATLLFLDKWGFWLLLAAAAVYYTLYFDCGLMLTGEQGSNALIAMRMLAGERPFVDMFIG